MFRFSAFCLTLLLLSAVGLSNGQQSQHLGNRAHMWIFGSEGVSIYRSDGSAKINQIPAEKACHNVTSASGSQIRCDWRDVVSDGKKYVWAAVSRGTAKIDIFSIETGAIVGAFDTCMAPRDLDFHPLRDEMWVHCGEYSDMVDSHLDVFSVSSPSAPISTSVTLHDGTLARSFGKLKTDPTLGDVAYATVYGQPFLHKIDLSSRVLEESFRLGANEPKLDGIYEMTYSAQNQHIFARTQVCCSCGFAGADLEECGHYGITNITVNGQQVTGQCGRHCEGGPTDTIGVYEFDTVTNSLVGTHPFVGSGAVDAPFASPLGDYIVMFGMNGGKTVDILAAGENGVTSQLAWTLNLDFNITNTEDMAVYADFAFIEHRGTKTIILSSSNENKVAIVDLASGSPEISYVVFSTDAVVSRSTRQIEWAHGTNYVWVSGRDVNKVYVVDYVEKTLVNTIDTPSTKFLTVQNDEFLAYSARIGDHLGRNGGTSSSSPASFFGGKDSDVNTTTEALSIAAIFMSTLAIVTVLGSAFMAMKKKKQPNIEKQGVVGKDEESHVLPSVN